MIKQEEIDDQIVARLADFIISNGRRGLAPDWFKMFTLARRVNAPVWEVAGILDGSRESESVPLRVWLVRALMVEFAEAAAIQMQAELLIRPSHALRPRGL